MSDHCKGCKTYNEHTNKCVAFFPNLKGECPCSNCLVKMICNYGCNNYNEYTVKCNPL